MNHVTNKPFVCEGSFAKRLAQEFPMWQVIISIVLMMVWIALQCIYEKWLTFLFMQFLLVDLRCHGDSASIKKRGPHTVASTALDVLKLVCSFLRQLFMSSPLGFSCFQSSFFINRTRCVACLKANCICVQCARAISAYSSYCKSSFMHLDLETDLTLHVMLHASASYDKMQIWDFCNLIIITMK